MKDKLINFAIVLKIFSLVITSWIAIHLLAIFGIFLAIAYPIFWLFSPKQSVCFFCRSKKEGDMCRLCHQEVNKINGIAPKNFSSAVGNGLIILLFSLVSIGLVYGESRVLYQIGFPPTPKTANFVIPTKGQYRLGEIFPMKIEVTGLKTSINAVQADLGFDPNRLEVIEVSTRDSFANIFIQKEINNEAGYVRLTGGLPNPGFFAERGVFGTVFLRGKEPGVVSVNFLPSSLVLANDGRGTNVLKDLAAVSYFVLPERISEEEEKEQEEIFAKDLVLGENSDNVKMQFYEENKILGESTIKEIKSKQAISQETDIREIALGWLGQFDEFILTLWGKLLAR